MARIQYEVDYPVAAPDVLAVLTDESFLDDYAREIGVLRRAARVTQVAGAPVTQLDFAVPTGGIPVDVSPFRRSVRRHP